MPLDDSYSTAKVGVIPNDPPLPDPNIPEEKLADTFPYKVEAPEFNTNSTELPTGYAAGKVGAINDIAPNPEHLSETNYKTDAFFKEYTGYGYDPNKSLSDTIPGLKFDVKASGSSPDAIKKRALEVLPKGSEVVIAPNPKNAFGVYYRTPDSDTFSPVISDTTDTSSVLGAIANPKNLIPTATAILSGGETLLPRILAGIAGGAAGSAATSASEIARGYEDLSGKTARKFGADVIESGVDNTIGEGVTSVAGAGLKLIGYPLKILFASSPTTKGKLMADAANEFNLPLPTPGQWAEGPTLAREKQLAGISPDAIVGRLADQRVELHGKIKEFANPEQLKQIDTDTLKNVVNQNEKDILSATTNPNKSFEESQVDLKNALNNWKTAQTELSSRQYADAFAKAESPVSFNIQGLKDEAGGVRTSIAFKRDPATLPEKEVEGVAPMEYPQEWGTTEFGADHEGLDVTNTPLADVPSDLTRKPEDVVIGTTAAQLNSIIDKIKNIDPNVATYDGVNGYQSLQALRGKLYDIVLANTDNLGNRNSSANIARNLYEKVNDALANPIGGGEGFTSAWKLADNTFRERREVLALPTIQKLLNSDNIDGVAKNIIKPENINTLKTLKKILPEDTYKATVQDSYITNLLNNPYDIKSQIDNLHGSNKEAVSLLLGDRQPELRAIGEKFAQLKSSGADKLINKYVVDGETTLNLIQNGNYKLLSDVANQGDAQKDALAAGMFANILQKSSQSIDGKDAVRPVTLANEIDKMFANLDKLDLTDKVLTPDSKRKFQLLNNYAKGSITTADTGASLTVAGLVEDVFNPANYLTTPGKVAKSMASIGLANRQANSWLNFHNKALFKYLGQEDKSAFQKGVSAVAKATPPAASAFTIGFINAADVAKSLATHATQSDDDKEQLKKGKAFFDKVKPNYDDTTDNSSKKSIDEIMNEYDLEDQMNAPVTTKPTASKKFSMPVDDILNQYE